MRLAPPTLLRPADLPAANALVPGLVVRAAFVAVGIGLALVDFRLGPGTAAAMALAVVAGLVPQSLLGWVLIVLLGAGRLGHHDALTWQFLVMLAGLHLLHVLGMLSLELPWRGWIDPVILAAPLIRFVMIQVPAQIVAIIALLVLAPNSGGHRPLTAAPFAVLGALALAALALLLLRSRAAEG